VTLATAVNGVKAPDRVKRPIGSSVRQSTSSSTTGASARAGATITSYWSIQVKSPRAKICSWAEARWVSRADIPRTSSHSAQLSGSISCSSGSRPWTSRPKATWSVTSGAKSAVKACSRVSSRHGAWASSTWCPSDSSRRPASWTASTRAGSSGASMGALTTTATFSAAGTRLADVAKGSAGGGAHDASPVSVPASTSSASAVSEIVCVSTPSTARKLSPVSGAREIRLRCGLSPTRPQHAAGMRVDPPPSLAWAIGTMPAATAVAEPPDEPPLVRDGSHGLRVGPKRLVLVHGRMPHSGKVVDPTTTKPASLRRRTTLWS
jgi:hypothetical protein